MECDVEENRDQLKFEIELMNKMDLMCWHGRVVSEDLFPFWID